jgi:oxygen-independent coproporphyrinogen-3 oxidase
MMRLRTVYGLDPREYEKKYLLPFAPLQKALEKNQEQSLAERTFDGRWHLTPAGFLVSNTIISDLLLIQEQCKPLARRR